jgi:hypothetical protein
MTSGKADHPSKFECIVRPHYRFGDDGPGTHVFVDEKELKNPSTMQALYTLEQAAELGRKLAVRREAKSQMRKTVEEMQGVVGGELRDLKARAQQAVEAVESFSSLASERARDLLQPG